MVELLFIPDSNHWVLSPDFWSLQLKVYQLYFVWFEESALVIVDFLVFLYCFPVLIHLTYVLILIIFACFKPVFRRWKVIKYFDCLHDYLLIVWIQPSEIRIHDYLTLCQLPNIAFDLNGPLNIWINYWKHIVKCFEELIRNMAKLKGQNLSQSRKQ